MAKFRMPSREGWLFIGGTAALAVVEVVEAPFAIALAAIPFVHANLSENGMLHKKTQRTATRTRANASEEGEEATPRTPVRRRRGTGRRTTRRVTAVARPAAARTTTRRAAAATRTRRTTSRRTAAATATRGRTTRRATTARRGRRAAAATTE